MKSLKTNFIYLALYKGLLALTPLIVAPYVSRILGVELIGEYSYFMSIIGFFTLTAGFGFDDYGSREIAKKRDNKEEYSKIFYSLISAKLLFGIILTIIFFSLNLSGSFGKENITFYNILFLQILAVFIDPFFLFTGLEKYKTIAIRTLIVKLFLIISIFIFVNSKDDFIYYCLIYSICVLASPLLMYLFIYKFINKPTFNKSLFIKSIKNSSFYFIPILSATLYMHLDKAMIQWITKDNAQNGFFEQATKLTNLIINVLGALNILMLSRMSYLYEIGDKVEINKKIEKSFNALFLLVLPCFFGLISINKFLMPGFFGIEYIGSINVIYAIAPIILFIPFRNLINSIYFAPKGKIYILNIFLIIEIIINVILNIFLIDKFGAIGAAIGTSLSEFITIIMCLIYIRKDISYKMIFKTLYKPLSASLIMLIFGITFDIFFGDYLINMNHGYLIGILIILFISIIIYGVYIYSYSDKLVLSILNEFKRKIIGEKENEK